VRLGASLMGGRLGDENPAPDRATN